MPATPPFFIRTWAPVSEWTAEEKSGSWPTRRTSSPSPAASASASNGPPASLGSSCGSMSPSSAQAMRAVSAARTFGLVEAGVDLDAESPQGGPGRARLIATLVGQRALRVGRAILGVTMPKQPNHCDQAP